MNDTEASGRELYRKPQLTKWENVKELTQVNCLDQCSVWVPPGP